MLISDEEIDVLKKVIKQISSLEGSKALVVPTQCKFSMEEEKLLQKDRIFIVYDTGEKHDCHRATGLEVNSVHFFLIPVSASSYTVNYMLSRVQKRKYPMCSVHYH